jgi:amino acid transporter
VARITALAANANVFATYAASLWPPFASPIGRIATIATLIGLVTAINMAGVRRAVRVLDLLTLLKALPLIALALWGLAWSAGSWPSPGPLPEISALEAAALIILYAFVGFENSVVPAGETADARRTIPRALIVTLVSTATLYFLIQLAYVSVMPIGPAPAAPLAAFAEVLIGPIGALILTATALASIAGNLAGSMTATPRVTYALANQGSLPRWFGAISARWATPANSILFMGLAGVALGVTGSFVWLAIVSTLARLIVYALCIAALPRSEKAGAGVWAMIAAALAVCVWAAAQSQWTSWAMLGGLVVAGFLLYALARRQAGSSSAATVLEIQPPPSTRSPS